MAAPVNDDFANAIVLDGTVPMIRTGDTNVEATIEDGEPRAVNYGEVDPATEWQEGVEASVWYRWTPSASGYYRARIDTSFDSILTVYSGGPAITALTRIGQSDLTYSDPSYEQVYVSASSGETYWFQVSGYGGETGDIGISVFAASHPANDDFADAEELTGRWEAATAGSNVGATVETGEVVSFSEEYGYYTSGFNSVWFRWTPTLTGRAIINFDPSDIWREFGGPMIEGFVGNALAELTPISESSALSDHGELTWGQQFAATAGATYYFRVSGSYTYGADEGTFTLSVQVSDANGADNIDYYGYGSWSIVYERIGMPSYIYDARFFDSTYSIIGAEGIRLFALSSSDPDGPWTFSYLSSDTEDFPFGFHSHATFDQSSGLWAALSSRRIFYWSHSDPATTVASVSRPDTGPDFYQSSLATDGVRWALMNHGGGLYTAPHPSGPWTYRRTFFNTTGAYGTVAYLNGEWVVAIRTGSGLPTYDYETWSASDPTDTWTLQSSDAGNAGLPIGFRITMLYAEGRYVFSVRSDRVWTSTSLTGPWTVSSYSVGPASRYGDGLFVGYYTGEGSTFKERYDDPWWFPLYETRDYPLWRFPQAFYTDGGWLAAGEAAYSPTGGSSLERVLTVWFPSEPGTWGLSLA